MLARAMLALLILLAGCGAWAWDQLKPGAPPDRAETALAIVSQVYAEAFGVMPPVESVKWIHEDQCGVGHPSFIWGGRCLSGLAKGCELVVAVRGRISDSALAHEVAHCAGWSHDRPDARYEPLITKANARLRKRGL